MKHFISLLIFLISFLALSNTAYATDLEVQCHETLCNVSSNDPIFPSSEHWTPEKSVEKSVLLKNTAGSEKDIFLKIYADGGGELDEYINLSLSESGAGTIWNGTLAQMISADTIFLTTLSLNSEFDLVMTASMDEQTPNTVMGGSSSFDFGFGFEGDQSGTNDDENSDDSNSDDSSSSSNSSSSSENSDTPIAAVFDQILTGAQTFFPNLAGPILDETSEVLAATESAAGETTSIQAGENDLCQDNPFWPLILVLETVILILVSWKLKGKVKILGGLLTVLTAGVLIFLLVCLKLIAVISLTPLLLLVRKKRITLTK